MRAHEEHGAEQPRRRHRASFLGERQRLRRLAQTSQEPVQPAKTEKPAKQAIEIQLGYLRAYAPQLALSVLDVPPRDEGVAGANVAIDDNNTTGNFLGQKFTLDVTEVKPDADVVPAFKEMIAKGDRYVLADVSAETIAVDRRYRARQRRADLQCRRHRRHSARRRVPGQCLPHCADALDAGRRAGAVSDLETVAALGADLRLA